MKTKQLLISLILGLGLALALIWALQGGIPPAVLALSASVSPDDLQSTDQKVILAPGADRVPGAGDPHLELAQATNAPTAELHVCSAGPPACDYATIQAAVDAANAGDAIKIAAGDYTGVHARAGVTQVVYIDQSLTLCGGYDTTNWNTSDPDANPTTLDAEGQGRVIYVEKDAYAPAITVTIEGLRITGGDATGMEGKGGGIRVDRATAFISDNVIFSNTGTTDSGETGYGGGAFMYNNEAFLTNNTFQDNIAASSSGPMNPGRGGGLGIDNIATVVDTFVVSGNTFISNTAGVGRGGQGGGLYHHGNGGAPLTVSGNTFRGNAGSRNDSSAGGGGSGGLHLYYDNVTLTDNVIEGNYGARDGSGNSGGLSHSSASITMTGNIVRNNVGGTNGGYAGGVLLSNSTFYLGGNTIEGNVASTNNVDGRGGGINIQGRTGTLSGNTIISNTASISGTGYGGGLYLSSNNTTLEGNIIQGNAATLGSPTNSYGGGAYVYGNTVFIRNIIRGNTSLAGWGQGGGLYLNAHTSTWNGNVIEGNVAADGGGIYAYWRWQGSDTHIWNSNVVADNRATRAGDGDGIYLKGANTASSMYVHLAHTTLARNGGGSGVYVTDATVWFTNTIVYSHTTGVENTDGVVTMTLTLWENNTSDIVGTAYNWPVVLGSAAFDANGADAAHPYHLTAASDAIDVGAGTGGTVDVDGQPRRMGLFPDLGADEYPYYADLSLAKARVVGSGLVSDPVSAGERVTFTLTLTNSPTSQVEADALLVDTLSPAAAVAGLDAIPPAYGSCQSGSAVVTCTLPNVPTTTIASITVVVTTTGTYDGKLSNTAAVTPTDAVDSDVTDNTAGPVTVDVVYVPPTPDLWMIKSGPGYAQSGETITYTLTWGNQGSTTAGGVVLTDTLPAEVTYLEADGSPTVNGCDLAWNLGSLAPGAEGTTVITVTVDDGLADGTELINTAGITTFTPDDPLENNFDEVIVVITELTLEVTKHADVSEAEVGDLVGYTIVIKNTNVKPIDAHMEDLIPSNAQMDWGPSADRGFVQYLDGAVTWIGTLGPGDTATIEFGVEVTGCESEFLDCGWLYNEAQVTLPGTSYTWIDHVSIPVHCPDLAVAIGGNMLTAQYNDGLFTTYTATIRYWNETDHANPGIAYDVRLTATISAAAHFVSSNPPPSGKVSDEVWYWDLGDLPPGAVGEIVIEAVPDPHKWRNDGYLLEAEIYANPWKECDEYANDDALITWPIKMDLEKSAEPMHWVVTYDPLMDERDIFLWQDYFIGYQYHTTDPRRSQVDRYALWDYWPLELTFEDQFSWPSLEHTGVYTLLPGSISWDSQKPLNAGGAGWLRVGGRGDEVMLKPGEVITNEVSLGYQVGEWWYGEEDYVVATSTVPVVAPLITWPPSGETCRLTFPVSGTAQPEVDVVVYVSTGSVTDAFETTSDAQGDFGAIVIVQANQSHTIWAEAKDPATGQISPPSDRVTVIHRSNIDWDPLSFYLKGITADGETLIIRPRNRDGLVAGDNWFVPGLSLVEYVSAHLQSCCTEPLEDFSFGLMNRKGDFTLHPMYETFPGVWETLPIRVNPWENFSFLIRSYCDEERVNKGWHLIDPDGYVFDETQGGGYDSQTGLFVPVQAIEGVTVTCMMSYTQWGGWVPWPAHLYDGQVNPQVTDDVYPDGVLEPGYYAFFTPPGHYYIQVDGIPGYQSWRSPVIEVITQVVHVNVPYTPWPEETPYTVTLTPEGISPAVITIPMGSSVEWTSALSSTNLLADLMRFSENPVLRALSARDPISDTLGWDAGMLEPGRVYRRRFGRSGIYHYTDGAGHSGVVVVEGFAIYLPLVLRSYTP